jgi:hypothetical protein
VIGEQGDHMSADEEIAKRRRGPDRPQDKVVLGQGLLEALDTLGREDVGPRVVLGHEFGHHLQLELNLFDSSLIGAEATRRTELMADADATFYAVHARGLSLNAKRVSDALQGLHDAR